MTDPEIERLIIQLGRFGEREEALNALVQMGAEVVDTLCRALVGHPWDVSEGVAIALVMLGPLAVEALLRTLTDRNPWLRADSARLLGKIGDRRAVLPLCRAASCEDGYVRLRAAEALLKLNDERAVEPLCQTLSHRDRAIRSDAARALGKFGDARAVGPLCRMFAAKEAYWTTAVEALGTMGDAETLPIKILLETRLTVVQRLEALDALRQVHHRGRIATQVYPLPEITDYCRQQLSHPEPTVRQEAQALLEARSLLRGSASTDRMHREELVRAAISTDARTDAQQLLRTSSQTEIQPIAPIRRKRSLSAWWRRR